MPEPSAKLAAKRAWLRMRRLLFPFRPLRWLALYFARLLPAGGPDPVIAELRRVRPYYRGTRLLTAAGLVLVLLAFIIPFSVVLVTWDTFMVILVAYAVLFIVSSLTGMVVQSAMDAVLALQHERRLTFRQALGAYLSIARANGDLAITYMSIKLAVDFMLSTLALGFFLPALLCAMAQMVRITGAIREGVDLGSDPELWAAVVAALAVAGLVATMLVALPAAAFYGYYTEEAVKMMGEACPEAAHQAQSR